MNRISNLYKTLYWIGDANGQLHLLDQTRLPLHLEHTICRTAEEVWQAIKVLKVRAPQQLRVSAAYGVVIGLQASRHAAANVFLREVERVVMYLATRRPTAINLGWALDRMQAVACSCAAITAAEIHDRLLAEAAQHQTGRSGNVFGDLATWEHVAEIGQLDPDPLQCGRASDGRRRHRTCRDVSGCRRWKKHSCLRR